MESYDLDRLARAVRTLVENQQKREQQNVSLRSDVEQKKRRIRELEEQLLAANQRRVEVGKRIDELIAQIDHLDAQFATLEPE